MTIFLSTADKEQFVSFLWRLTWGKLVTNTQKGLNCPLFHCLITWYFLQKTFTIFQTQHLTGLSWITVPEDETQQSNAEGIVLHNFIDFAGCFQNSMLPLNRVQPVISSNHFSPSVKALPSLLFSILQLSIYYTCLFNKYLHLLNRSQFSTIPSVWQDYLISVLVLQPTWSSS